VDVFLDEYAGHWFIPADPFGSANWFFIRKNNNINIIIFISIIITVFYCFCCCCMLNILLSFYQI